jgi:redox-sensitive bicupin YhaK (pirin superfamily)
MNGVQAWIALPIEAEETAPSFAHHGADEAPTYESGGLWGRLIAGEAFGAKARVETYSPMFYVHWTLQPGARGQLDAEYSERAAYVAQGSVEIDGKTFHEGQMVVFAPGSPVVITGVTAAIVMLLGGEPVGERFIEWNFVASSKDRIEQAKADWRAGRMKLPDADDQEFIPLPPDPTPPANPMS